MQHRVHEGRVLFDHLVGAQQKRLRNVQAERLRGRKIEDQIELGRLLNRDVGGLRPAQNLVDQVAGAAVEYQSGKH